MTVDRRTTLNHERLEAFVREQLEEGLAPFINDPINDDTRHRIRSVLASRLAQMTDAGDVPPDFFRHVVRSTPEDTVRGVVSMYMVRNFAAYPMTEPEFRDTFGRDAGQDDLHRVNCTDAGAVGHYQCGWCMTHETARFACGCIGGGQRGAPSIGRDPHAPVCVAAGATAAVLAPPPVPVAHAPRIEGDERMVFSAADVDAVARLGEVDTDTAIMLKAAFMRGDVRAIRLVRWLPEDHPPRSALVREGDVLDFIRARFPDVCDQSVEARSDSMSYFVTVTTRLEGSARQGLAERIRDALTPHTVLGVAFEVRAIAVQAL